MSDLSSGLNPVHLYAYLVKARAKLFEWIRPLTLEAAQLVFHEVHHRAQANGPCSGS